MDLTTLIEPKPDLPRLAQVLDELGPLGRLHCVLGWEGRKLALLFDALQGFREATLEDLLPSSVEAGQDAVHRGTLSSGMFHYFEKRFTKPAAAEGAPAPEAANEQLWGITRRSPGFLGGDSFIARAATAADAAGELELDHRAVPKGTIAGWPAPSTFSPASDVDKVRSLTSHIFVARAFRASGSGEATKLDPHDRWYAFCRVDRAET